MNNGAHYLFIKFNDYDIFKEGLLHVGRAGHGRRTRLWGSICEVSAAGGFGRLFEESADELQPQSGVTGDAFREGTS